MIAWWAILVYCMPAAVKLTVESGFTVSTSAMGEFCRSTAKSERASSMAALTGIRTAEPSALTMSS